MWRPVVFLPLALALLCSCSKNPSHPVIVVTPQNGGSSFQISGARFSNVNPCATLSYVVLPSGPPQTIEAHVPCPISGQLGLSSLPVPGAPYVSWTPAQPTCTANIPISVIAVDAVTGDAATARASILCEAALCPTSFAGNKVLATSMATYFSKGSSTNVQTYGPMGLMSALQIDHCIGNAMYALQGAGEQVNGGDVDGVPQSGAFEQCTYKNTNQCPVVMTLTFTCPDSGACVKP